MKKGLYIARANCMNMKLMSKLIAILLILFVVSGCALIETTETKQLVVPAPVGQWAVTASASSAYGSLSGEGRDDQSPYAATGEPDVTDCRDDQKAWVPSEEDHGEQWLELTYDTDVYISKVRVRETLGPGSVIKVEGKTDSGYEIIWQGVDNTEICPGYFEAEFSEMIDDIPRKMTSYKTDTIRITLDTDKENWNEIDAVELIGYTDKWYVYNETLYME